MVSLDPGSTFIQQKWEGRPIFQFQPDVSLGLMVGYVPLFRSQYVVMTQTKETRDRNNSYLVYEHR